MSEASTSQLQQWITLLNEGDPRARDELIQRSMARMRRLVRHSLSQFTRLRRFEDTDDVLQSVIIRMMRRLETVRPPTVADYFRLAASEARRALLDLTRHYCGPCGAGNREAQLNLDNSNSMSPGLEAADTTYSGDRLAYWQEFHAQIEQLPPEEADVFAMIWYNDLKQEEVALALGVSVPTVKRRWLAARIRLQQWLEGMPD